MFTTIIIKINISILADTIIAGSLFQVAIGGKKIRKTVAKNVTEYDSNGKACGQHLETIELWEEMPPNVEALKFLATHKLSEKFGDKQVDNSSRMKDLVNKFTPEQMAIIEMASKETLDEENHKGN